VVRPRSRAIRDNSPARATINHHPGSNSSHLTVILSKDNLGLSKTSNIPTPPHPANSSTLLQGSKASINNLPKATHSRAPTANNLLDLLDLQDLKLLMGNSHLQVPMARGSTHLNLTTPLSNTALLNRANLHILASNSNNSSHRTQANNGISNQARINTVDSHST
jgi:hypothetical protein